MEIKNYKSWEKLFNQEREKEYFTNLLSFLDKEYEKKTIFPKQEEIFKAFETPLEEVKVVIVGQDCYHNVNQAMGLAFSVNKNVDIPPSLKNIFKEIFMDLGILMPSSGNLTKWAEQGVFLLNSCLTVEAHKPASHSKVGWETFTDETIKVLNEDNCPKVFMLWGNYAKSKKELITNTNHLVLEAAHPSPLSVNKGFFGCKHFSKVNEFLSQNGIKKINWDID